MKYFTINELTKSTTAIRKGIDNTPSAAVKANLTALVDNILDPLRDSWGAPIIVTSGYRCPKLNRAVGGSSTSQHKTGQAADIHTLSDTLESNLKLMRRVVSLNLPFDQMIWEYGDNRGPDWVHVSFVRKGGRRQILRAMRNSEGKTYYITIKL